VLSGRTRLKGQIQLWYMGARPWTAGPRTGEEVGCAERGIRPKSLRKLENIFSFSKLFYKLETNLNSNQI
jgi:hypothetical protein